MAWFAAKAAQLRLPAKNLVLRAHRYGPGQRFGCWSDAGSLVSGTPAFKGGIWCLAPGLEDEGSVAMCPGGACFCAASPVAYRHGQKYCRVNPALLRLSVLEFLARQKFHTSIP